MGSVFKCLYELESQTQELRVETMSLTWVVAIEPVEPSSLLLPRVHLSRNFDSAAGDGN